MDLKSVQQQLKANILKHQEIMIQLKKSPQDVDLRARLKEIQKHIAELGTKQKQLKSHQQSNDKDKPLDSPPENVADIPARKFVKIAPKKDGEHNGQSPKSLSGLQVQSKTQMSITSVEQKHNGTILQPALKFTAIAPKTDHKTENQLKTNGGGEGVAKSRQNGLDSPNIKVSPVKDALNLSIKSQPTAPSHSTSKNIIMHAPVKIKVPGPPASTTASFVLLATNATNSKKNPTLLRLVQRGQHVGNAVSINANQGSLVAYQPKAITKTSNSKAHVWLNVTKAASNQKPIQTPSQQPKAILPKGDAPLHKLRIVSGGNPPTLNKLNENIVAKPQPETESPEPSNSSIVSTHNEETTKVNQTSPKCVTPEPTDPENKKLCFLDVLDLVPKEKADRLRNRRYGKRKSAAHPVYSGGIYVSTTGTDLSKRILPPDLLGFEEVPVKRPRGRPRGSGKNSLVRNRPPPMQANTGGALHKEVSKIIEQTRPNRPGTSRETVSKSLDRKGTSVKGDSHQDHCAVCNKTGEVLMCDTCSLVYHISCLKPPLKVVPTGMWYCNSCREKFNDSSSAPKWPGLMSVVHSYFAFDRQRRGALESARQKTENLKQQRTNRQTQIKTMASDLLAKVTSKNKAIERNRELFLKLQKLQTKVKTIRNIVNEKEKCSNGD